MTAKARRLRVSSAVALGVLAAQCLGRDVFRQQQLEPVEEFRGRGLLLDAGDFAQLVEALQRGGQEVLLERREVDLDDVGHRLTVREFDVVEEAAAQEGVRQFLLVVRGDDHQRAVPGHHHFARLVDIELHAVQFAQQVVRELDVGLVDLVDEQHHRLGGGEGLPQHALDDVVVDVAHALVAQLRIAQARDGVVFVQALLRLGGRLHVPLQQRHVERGRHFLGQHGLAGAGFALDQERTAEGERGVDGQFQVGGGDVVVAAFEALGCLHRG